MFKLYLSMKLKLQRNKLPIYCQYVFKYMENILEQS